MGFRLFSFILLSSVKILLFRLNCNSSSHVLLCVALKHKGYCSFNSNKGLR